MAGLNLIYPNAVETHEIDQDLISGPQGEETDDVTLSLLPRQNENTHNVRWLQLDNYYGIMGMRGLDGSPSKVIEVGTSSYVYEPGVYGEFMEIGEREMTSRAAPMNPNLPIPVTDLVTIRMRQLRGRQYDRIRYNIWTLLGTGTLNIPANGPTGFTTYQDSYSIQTYTAPIPWSSTSTATPIQNLQYLQQLGVGHSVDLGAKANLFMNQVTANRMLNNSNAADFGGRRNSYGATLNNMVDAVNYFAAQNLPKPTIFDEGFMPYQQQGPITNSAVQFQKFIPNGLSICFGVRKNNAPVGRFKMTLQGVGGAVSSEPYSFIQDFATGSLAPRTVPPKLVIQMGFNGGPVLEYPSSVIAFTTG